MTDFPPLPALENLTSPERDLVAAVRRGQRAFQCSSLTADDLAHDVDPSQEIRARVLRDLLIGLHGPLDPHGVWLSGARISYTLDLDNVRSSVSLVLDSCVVEGEILLRGAHLPNIMVLHCVIGGLDALHLRVDGILRLRGTRARGDGKSSVVRLTDARVDGEVDLDKTVLTNTAGPALSADNLRVAGNLLLRDAQLSGSGRFGAVRLVGAQVEGLLLADDVVVRNDTGPALFGDRLRADGLVEFRRADIVGHGDPGAIVLQGISIGGSANFAGAKICNDGGTAMTLDNSDIHGNLRLDQTRIAGRGEWGALSASSTRVGSQLVFSGANIENDTGPAVVLEGAKIDGAWFWPVGIVCSTPGARERCAGAKTVNVDDCTFAVLEGSSWEEWLHVIRFHTAKYRPAPYQQLAAVERAAGHDGNARRILIAQQQDLHHRAPEALGGWWSRRIHKLWGALAGYGYRTRRTALALASALAVAGVLGFMAGRVAEGSHNVAERVSDFGAPAGRPCTTVELVGLGLDRGLPLSPTGIRARCDINPDVPGASLFTVAIWLVQAAVWGLATLALAGYTGLIRKAG
ncbi:hypothetical protein ACIA5G_18390 [Amycolatopsis sp. NPDC051758]|uniref:hypothetical protein n=1 Tax=Amycolatopsis sp. NPDC051758 TaxID=3363935 RepID=UPI0037B8C679